MTKYKNKIAFRLKHMTIEELDKKVKEQGFKNRSVFINEAIQYFIKGNKDLKDHLKFFYDIFVKNASKFIMDLEDIQKVEIIEGVLD